MQVKEIRDIETNELTGYQLDGMFVPLDKANRHYQEIKEWIQNGNKPEPAFTEEERLNYFKKKKKHEIGDVYNKKRQEPIEVNGYTFQADDKSVDTIKTYISVGSKPKWLTIDNKFVDIDLKVLLKAITDRTNELFVEKINIKKKVDECKSIDCIERIVYE